MAGAYAGIGLGYAIVGAIIWTAAGAAAATATTGAALVDIGTAAACIGIDAATGAEIVIGTGAGAATAAATNAGATVVATTTGAAATAAAGSIPGAIPGVVAVAVAVAVCGIDIAASWAECAATNPAGILGAGAGTPTLAWYAPPGTNAGPASPGMAGSDGCAGAAAAAAPCPCPCPLHACPPCECPWLLLAFAASSS